jgi:cyanophycinase
VIRDAIEIGARVLDREQTGAGVECFRTWAAGRTGSLTGAPPWAPCATSSSSAEVGDAAAVYVAGGLTPAYQQRCVPGDWLPPAVAYAGFSAGAAIAARRALVGGWRVERDGRRIPVCPEDASEDLDLVERRDSLALVPFTVDVHAAQWGTTTRLLRRARPRDGAPRARACGRDRGDHGGVRVSAFAEARRGRLTEIGARAGSECN